MKERWYQLFEIFERENPNPQTELIFSNAYTLLIAVILSAQTTDAQVNKATPKLFDLAPNPEIMSTLQEEQIATAIKSLNLYKSKARYVLKTSKILFEKYNSQVPSSLEELVSLPGVGRKTANVVLNVIFNQATLPIDTHVARVSNRIGIVKSEDIALIEKELLNKIPKKFIKKAHHWLVLHGRYICKSRKPLCASCKVSSLCDFNTLSK